MEPRRMDIFSFVQKKLMIDDVEPMYTAITLSRLPLRARQRLCFAEGLADHLGLAARMAEGEDFWRSARCYVEQPIRGGARRYFRGAPALDAIRAMQRRFPDLSDFFKGLPDTFQETRRYIMDLPQFGPFSAFKIADMAERTCGANISFEGVGLKDFSKFPQRGAKLAADFLTDEERTITPEEVFGAMLRKNWKRWAPPLYDRPLGPQEIETMFCNYGHSAWHEPGYEGRELKKLLEGHGKLAAKLSSHIGGMKC